MYTEIEKEEPEVRYNQIHIPFTSLEAYERQGWELVEVQGSIAVIRKELKA